MTPNTAFAALEALANVEKAAEMAAYHKVARPYLGISVPQIDELAREWRQTLPLEERIELASSLLGMGIHETMIAGAKLLEQARIRPEDDSAWALISTWAQGFEGEATSDYASVSGQKRLVANPARINDLEAWTKSENRWTRRAVLVMTLPWAKMNNPKAQDIEIRERVLGWAAAAVADRNWFMQKAIAQWISDLSRHDAERAAAFLNEHGQGLKSFAQKDAARFLSL